MLGSVLAYYCWVKFWNKDYLGTSGSSTGGGDLKGEKDLIPPKSLAVESSPP